MAALGVWLSLPESLTAVYIQPLFLPKTAGQSLTRTRARHARRHKTSFRKVTDGRLTQLTGLCPAREDHGPLVDVHLADSSQGISCHRQSVLLIYFPNKCHDFGKIPEHSE